ncbi:transposase [Nostoc sp. FACHB-892]|nr:transposase [Nostoc sp. FACHB-892]
MSIHPQNIPDIPLETVQVARAAFPKGNIYLQIRDTLGCIYEDETFVELFSPRRQPAESPWGLALICVM